MKKSLIISMFIASAIFLFLACDSKQPADQLLKNDTQRSEIITKFVDHQPYRMEMMNAMMNNDSCRIMMSQKMMEKPEMTHMMMSDPEKVKGTMDHMVTMAAKDTLVFNIMIQMMKDKPEMWNNVMKMNTSSANVK